MAQHHPTGSEISPSYAPRSSRFGSEPPSVEDDVDVWRYAIVSCMPETITNDTYTQYYWPPTIPIPIPSVTSWDRYVNAINMSFISSPTLERWSSDYMEKCSSIEKHFLFLVPIHFSPTVIFFEFFRWIWICVQYVSIWPWPVTLEVVALADDVGLYHK